MEHFNMKSKFLANRTFNVKPYLKKVEKEFEKCGIKLDFDLEKIDIPIVWDTTWGSPVYTDANWFYNTFKAGDSQIVALGIDKKDWRTKKGGNKHTPRDYYGLEVQVKKHKMKSGKDWLVHILCHEMSHILFQMERRQLGLYNKIDETHNYITVDNKKWQLKECLSHLDKRFLKSLK